MYAHCRIGILRFSDPPVEKVKTSSFFRLPHSTWQRKIIHDDKAGALIVKALAYLTYAMALNEA